MHRFLYGIPIEIKLRPDPHLPALEIRFTLSNGQLANHVCDLTYQFNEAFMSFNKSTIGYSVQAGGAGCVLVGAVLSVHHAAIAACLLAGSAALYIGKRIRSGI